MSCKLRCKNEFRIKQNAAIKLGPNERIDGTAALIDALAVRQKFYSEIGRQLQNKR